MGASHRPSQRAPQRSAASAMPPSCSQRMPPGGQQLPLQLDIPAGGPGRANHLCYPDGSEYQVCALSVIEEDRRKERGGKRKGYRSLGHGIWVGHRARATCSAGRCNIWSFAVCVCRGAPQGRHRTLLPTFPCSLHIVVACCAILLVVCGRLRRLPSVRMLNCFSNPPFARGKSSPLPVDEKPCFAQAEAQYPLDGSQPKPISYNCLPALIACNARHGHALTRATWSTTNGMDAATLSPLRGSPTKATSATTWLKGEFSTRACRPLAGGPPGACSGRALTTKIMAAGLG